MYPKCDILTLRAHFLFEMMSLRVQCVCDFLSICFDLSFDILAVGNGLNLGSTTHTACLIIFSFFMCPRQFGADGPFLLTNLSRQETNVSKHCEDFQ